MVPFVGCALVNQLLIFAKYPEAGRVKTRLAQRVGVAKATALYRDMVETVVRQTATDNGGYQRVLYYDPPEREREFKSWLKLEYLKPQYGADLGERLFHAVSESLEQASRAIVIGSDCVDIDRELIEAAFVALDDNDLVLGPAEDGGYYLLGCKQVRRELFDDIDWSTEQVLAQTLARVARLGWSHHLLPVRADID